MQPRVTAISAGAGNRRRDHGVYIAVNPLGAMLLLTAMFAAQGSAPLPWVYPGDFRERLRMSDLVVAGTIEDTRQAGSRTVDGVNVTANLARLRVDRVFEGSFSERELRFTWFALRWETTGGEGYAYSGPPLADIRPGQRYLAFLRWTRPGWEVTMPVYAIEVGLAAVPPRGSVCDLSQAPVGQRYQALAGELENAALALPAPPQGMTGEAASYLPYVFDLLGGCAEQFYSRFLSSPSPELRRAVSTWLELIRSQHLACGQHLAPPQ